MRRAARSNPTWEATRINEKKHPIGHHQRSALPEALPPHILLIPPFAKSAKDGAPDYLW